MIGLIQRVSSAQVLVDQISVGQIDAGLLVLLCAERGDSEKEADALLKKLLGYRVFSDEAGKMNRSVSDTNGQLLIVSQFTLAADTNSGTRPSFTPAASPAEGKRLYEYFVSQSQHHHCAKVATGEFGADMQVALTNDGPVTFWLQVKPKNLASSTQ